MKLSISFVSAACVVAVSAAAALVWQAPAQSQVRVTPALQPVGAASGGATTAWFQDTAAGRVIACQTTGSGASLTVACAAAALP